MVSMDMGRLYIVFSIVLAYLVVGCGGSGVVGDNTLTHIQSQDITIRYGDDAHIIFDWNKSNNTKESIYLSSQKKLDDGARLLTSRRDKGHYTIECNPNQQNANEIIYICKDGSTMKLSKTHRNYILLESTPVGDIHIIQTEERIHI